jgi:hypothetical protein
MRSDWPIHTSHVPGNNTIKLMTFHGLINPCILWNWKSWTVLLYDIKPNIIMLFFSQYSIEFIIIYCCKVPTLFPRHPFLPNACLQNKFYVEKPSKFILIWNKLFYYMNSDVFSDWLTSLVTFFDKTLYSPHKKSREVNIIFQSFSRHLKIEMVFPNYLTLIPLVLQLGLRIGPIQRMGAN